MVSLGAGGLPVTGGVSAIGVCGVAVLATGQAVLVSGISALPGREPVSADLGQQVTEGLPVFPARLSAGTGHSPACRPFLPFLPFLPGDVPAGGRLRSDRLITQVSVPQQVADALLGNPGKLVGVVGQAVTVPGRLIALISMVIALPGTGITAIGRIIAVIAGFSPGRWGGRSQPDALPLSSRGHPLPQQRRGLRCHGTQRVQPVPGRQLFQQRRQRDDVIFIQHGSSSCRPGQPSAKAAHSRVSRLPASPDSTIIRLGLH